MRILKIVGLVLAWGITAAVLALLIYQVSRNARLSATIAQTRAPADDP